MEFANSQISNAVAWIGDLSEALNELSQARTDSGVQANNSAVDAGVTAVGDAGGALIDWANTVEVSAPAGEETLGNTVTLWWPPDTDFDGNPIASGQRTFGPGTSRHVYEQFKASHPGAMELDGQIPEWLPSQFLPPPPAPPEPAVPIDFVTPAIDWGTALTPGVSTARDVYEIGTGRDLVTDEEIGLLGRGLALAGFFTPAGGKSLRYGGEQIVNGAGHFWNWMRRGANNVPARPAILVDAQARRHILDGDITGGGHRSGTGITGKSEFPADWSDDKILETASDIATDPTIAWSVPNRRGYITGTKTVEGVEIKVVYDTANGRIVTAYPVNVPRNP